jgi:hypothetical protein
MKQMNPMEILLVENNPVRVKVFPMPLIGPLNCLRFK